eukprot:TRINITY_DN436_c0_g1_i4.p1 TRINITY_DN436_c0_g1~~TRINITY_DN436_c0_g1_i4.p1  ORF type:complete len:285 (-),score=0.63 TRINITY_DN436_c0_g1_i4:2719-3573(-)
MRAEQLSRFDSLLSQGAASPFSSCTTDSTVASPIPSACGSNIVFILKDIKLELKYRGISSFLQGTEMLVSVKISIPNMENSRLVQYETLSYKMILGQDRELEIDCLVGQFMLNFPIQLTFGVHQFWNGNYVLAAEAGCMIQEFDLAFNSDSCFRNLCLLGGYGEQCGYLGFQAGIFSVEQGCKVAHNIIQKRCVRSAASTRLQRQVSRSMSQGSVFAGHSSIILEEEEGQEVQLQQQEKQAQQLFNTLDKFYIGNQVKKSGSRTDRRKHKLSQIFRRFSFTLQK